jgi:hypothetical protein
LACRRRPCTSGAVREKPAVSRWAVDKFDRKYLDKYIEKHTVKARGVAPAATEEAA